MPSSFIENHSQQGIASIVGPGYSLGGSGDMPDVGLMQGTMTPIHSTMPSDAGLHAKPPTVNRAGIIEGSADAVLSGNSDSARESDHPNVIPFHRLAQCRQEVWIEHEGQIYRLRRTKLGKLILTK